jgi:hypothetical protein
VSVQKMNQSGSPCTYADVQVVNDNDEFPEFSKIEITVGTCSSAAPPRGAGLSGAVRLLSDADVWRTQVESTPGLLRLITWVLTGLDVNVQTAQIRTDELTGIAQHTFYVLNAWGEKV